MDNKKIKIGVFGVGYLGKFHVQQLNRINDVEIIGFYDPDDDAAEYMINKYGLCRSQRVEDLIERADVLDIVAPTAHHFELASMCAKLGKHFFIEKPIASSIEEGKQLAELVRESRVKCQVGYIERYNPAYLNVRHHIKSPLFVEAHRLTPFNIRNRHISVVYDLMIHDIDLLLSLIPSNVKSVLSSGASVLSDAIDVANARIVFHNGCVANLTASRLALKKMRKMRIFQEKAYITMDFAEQYAEYISLYSKNTVSDKKQSFFIPIEGIDDKVISYQKYDKQQSKPNPLFAELESFINGFRDSSEVDISVYDGLQSLLIAHQIMNEIQHMSVNTTT